MQASPRVDPDGTVRERYRAAAAEALAAGELTEAKDTWVSFVRASHGAVFERVAGPASAAADEAFLDALTFDYLLESLFDALEAATGVTVLNRGPTRNTDVPVALGDVHDEVLAPAAGRRQVCAEVDEATLRGMTPEALRRLYEQAVDPAMRLALGEYYTPPAVAALAVERVAPSVGGRLLDPGCGAGAFLTAALDALALPDDPRGQVRAATDAVAGIDINPVAVKAAKLTYAAALFDALAAVKTVEIPVFLTDALALSRADELRFRGERLSLSADTLVGNPPWVPWERLSEHSKRAWRETHVEDLGLKPHEGAAARLGHSNDDVSVPFAWACIDRYLRQGGRASLVLKRELTRGPAGAVLRRLRVGDRPLAPVHVDDLSALSPFADVSVGAAVYTFRADDEPSFPVSATAWRSDDGRPPYGSLSSFRAEATGTETELVPLEPGDHTTPWLRADAERAALGDCDHDIRHGLKDDASAVFGLDRAALSRVDGDLVYPYLRSRHVRRWRTTGHDLRLVPQRRAGEDNEAWLADAYPGTYEYLRDNRAALESRSSSWLDRGPFYSVFGLGPYTWAPYKLVWCRLGFNPEFAVVSTRTDPDLGERPVVPGDHYMFVATDRREVAHFLCALLNAAPYQRTLRDLAGDGQASLSKSVVSELVLPAWPDDETARRLAALSMRAHEAAASSATGTLAEVEARVDRLVAEWLTGEGG